MYFTIVPKWDFSLNKKDTFPKYYKFSVFLVVFLSLCQVLYETFASFHNIWHASTMVTYNSAISVISWTLLYFTIKLNSSNHRWYLVLKRVSEMPTSKENFKRINNVMLWKFIFTMFLHLTIFVSDLFFYDFILLYALACTILLLLLQIYSSIIFNVLIVLRENFKKILRELQKPENFLLQNQDIKMLQRRYLRIIDACEIFNDLSGPIFLLMTISSSVQLLFCVNLVTFFVKTSEHGAILAITIFYGLVHLHYSVGSILACHLVEKEARKIVRQCFKKIGSPMMRETRRNDLLTFAMIAKNNLPEFTAWGFFNLTRGTILSLLNTTATYMVISYQFRNE